ncbi:DUF4373 domain-containing protein [Pseudoramibacter alactolyticus]|uniref:DUF4373 domain-containing protein n=1 Tax=Pseudoramibacter alactolyticus TaxID=113287 RepID=UPI00248D3C4E|nr:DUF4373 domain-containing protein [Pseudoramibacter alactolyticus]
MARPVKQGLDYFPFDVDLINDRKLRKAKLKHGYQATMVYIVLLTLIYKDKGYYLDYRDDVQEDVILDVIDCMQGKYRPDIETVREIIHQLAEDRLFDLDSLGAGFLTSRRIQQTYYKAVSDRKTVNINWECWLLNEKDMQGLGSGNPILKNYSLQAINSVNRPINRVYHPDNTQSKGDKSKGDKSKGDILSGATDVASGPAPSPVVYQLPLNTKKPYPITKADIKEWHDLYPAVDIKAELRKMRGWLDANPQRRKTDRGIKRFINSWLSREQDRGGRYHQSVSNGSRQNQTWENPFGRVMDEKGM